ncbi:hypothetical protein [Sphingomonas sp.]|jgi:hypothetical protein|uniref:hypothetical protein n=1 Tax=Sphingomonas sp. TaxID=28214 RepID=UPI0026357FB1|nr:hypothetical protein [Sphingomonas sp.]MDF2605407.1 hypothetical protein [Sphingomonas sp.]
MTHTPPVPPGNQSPFPIQEPPHTPTTPEAPSAKQESGKPDSAKPAAAKAAGSDEWAAPAKRRWSLGKIAGATAGIGAIAIGVAAVLFPRDSAPEPKKKKRKN